MCCFFNFFIYIKKLILFYLKYIINIFKLSMDIPFDLLHIVASYLVKPKMILLDWIDIDMLDWDELMNNPNAHNLIETAVLNNPDVINWNSLCLNPNAIHILETVLQHDPDKINWYYLSKNPNAIHLLEIALQDDPDKIDWTDLSTNLDKSLCYTYSRKTS